MLSGGWRAAVTGVSGEAAGSWRDGPAWTTLRRSGGGRASARVWRRALGPARRAGRPGRAEASGPGPGAARASRAGRSQGSQRSVPGFEQHALQKQLAVTVHVGLVQPQGQVAQGEVAVRGVRQLLRDRALQAQLLPVHVGQLAGRLVWKKRKGP